MVALWEMAAQCRGVIPVRIGGGGGREEARLQFHLVFKLPLTSFSTHTFKIPGLQVDGWPAAQDHL